MINLMNAVTTKSSTLNVPEVKAASERQPVSASGNISPPASGSPQPSAESVKAAAAQVSRHLEVAATSLSISVDDGLGSTVIQVKDKATDEVIRQIPPEQILNLARFLRESAEVGGFELADTMKGLMVDSTE